MASIREFAWMASLALSTATAPAAAQVYPSKPITVIAAFPPGAPNDFIARLVAERFPAASKQPIVVENRPGAGGNIAADVVARSSADGHTLLATVDTTMTVNPVIYRKLGFNADADFVPVIYLANTAQTLVCHPSVPAKSVAELVTYAKSHPMSYASGGSGVPGHLAAELFLAATAVTMTHVPYRGPGPATQDVLAGIVPCGFLATPVVMPHVKTGKLTALAVTAAKRSPLAPEVPTMAEAGVPGAEATFGEMLLAPRDTPLSVITWLNETFGSILQSPDARERMSAVDLVFVPNTPAQAASRLQQDRAKWRPVAERLGLRVD